MNDEIKEIINELENIIKISDYKNHYHLNEYFEIEHIDKLLIYIKNYKSRVEKAIEYIKTKKAIINTDYIRIFDLFEIDEQGYIDNLLNILQGGKDE